MESGTKKLKSKWIIAAAAAVLFLAGGMVCLMAGKDPQAGQEDFDAYMDALFREDVAENTINLHYTLAHPENYGITDYDISLGSYTSEDIEESYRELKEIRERLLSFDIQELSNDQKLTYDIVLDYVETELSTEGLMLYAEVLGPTTGYQAQLPVVLAEYAFRTKQDIEDYLALISKMDEMAAQIIAFEREKAQAGLFMSDYAADAIIEQCKEFIKNPEENYMIDVFNDKIDAFGEPSGEKISEEEKEDFKERNHEIITTEVVDCYRTLIDGLAGLKGSGVNELGLCYYENGKEYYEYLVRSGTGSDMPIKKQEKRVENFIENYFQMMWKAMNEDPEIYEEAVNYQFPDMEPEAVLQDLTEKIGEDFPEPPDVGYTVKYVHPSMQEHMSPAFYLTTPVDDIQNNLIYINEKYTGKDGGTKMELYPTLAHEGYPGHLYQNACTASSGLPLIRNMLSFSGYAEGWASYVEFEYAYDFAGMDEKLADILSGNEAVSLALSAYIDMGVHYDGWDREDVAEYLEGFMIDDQEAVNEIFEYIVEEPSNYLSYFIGYLEFLDLRKTAEEALGENFDVKDFHAFLLELGPAPFYIIKDYMQEWIEAYDKG